MQSFGNYLKERRESKNVSLRDISRTTKITERYLDSIEKDEFEKVPGGAYIRGYISSYASFIGIDAHETLERFDSFRREKHAAEHEQEALSKEKVKRNPIMFLSNKGKWVIICSAILILVILGAINLLSRDDGKDLVVADSHGGDGKELRINDATRSKDPQSLETAGYAKSYEKTKNLPKPSALTSRPSDHLNEGSKGKASIQEAAEDYRKAGEHKIAEFSEHSRVEDKESDQSTHKKQLNRKGREISKPRTLTTTPDIPTGQDRSNPEKYIKVLKTAVCTEVKDKNPFGKVYSVQWSTDRVYVWNLTECETGHSSIRHIYYFEGKRVSDIALDIRSPRWRTWSFKALSDKRFIGTWRVDITSADGKLLESVQFEVS